MKTLNSLIELKMKSLEEDGKVSTNKSYRTLLSYIESHFGEVDIKSVNPEFAKKMKKVMTAEGKSTSTINNYFALLSSIFNYAVYKKYTTADKYPFQRKSYELDKVKKPKPVKRTDWFLKKEQMQLIYGEWQKETNQSIKRYVGIFLASYLCNGANLADVLRLRYDSNYYKNDKKVLVFTRKKTQGRSDSKVTIPITTHLKSIIDAIGDSEAKNGYVFGSFLNGIDTTNQSAIDGRVMYINTYTSKVARAFCNRIGIEENVSVTYARHSYSTILNHLNAPYSIVEYNLGHSLSGVSGNYIAKPQIEDLFKYNELLL